MKIRVGDPVKPKNKYGTWQLSGRHIWAEVVEIKGGFIKILLHVVPTKLDEERRTWSLPQNRLVYWENEEDWKLDIKRVREDKLKELGI